MPNIGTLLKQEISRLSKKEAKSQNDGIRRASTQYRHDIAALKRKLSDLERQIARLSKTQSSPTGKSSAADTGERRTRFVAKGLRSLRTRLGLSAADLGVLLDSSAQSVYNWEGGTTRPRAAQLVKITALRSVSKKDVQTRLTELRAPKKRAKRVA